MFMLGLGPICLRPGPTLQDHLIIAVVWKWSLTLHSWRLFLVYRLVCETIYSVWFFLASWVHNPRITRNLACVTYLWLKHHRYVLPTWKWWKLSFLMTIFPGLSNQWTCTFLLTLTPTSTLLWNYGLSDPLVWPYWALQTAHVHSTPQGKKIRHVYLPTFVLLTMVYTVHNHPFKKATNINIPEVVLDHWSMPRKLVEAWWGYTLL